MQEQFWGSLHVDASSGGLSLQGKAVARISAGISTFELSNVKHYLIWVLALLNCNRTKNN